MVQRGEQRGADVDIEGADILVAGGRGLGKAEGFELCEELAEAFGGSAVAATRAVVDAGWYPYAAQIGQTGKTVAPKLYLAAGISGAIQHKVGMQSSENIVAINKDANAPIFEFSDLGHRRRPQQDPAQAHRGREGQEGRLSRWPSPTAGRRARRQFPPPVDSQQEFIKRELDDEDERIEVGVAIVGGGTAGLACANRLLQLLADDPELMERLGEVPVAVIEKAKTCGGHNLSGAVMRPGPLQELFPDLTREDWREEGFAFGEVDKEAVYLMPTAKRADPHPDAAAVQEPRQRGRLGRRAGPLPAAQAEEGGAYILTETVGDAADRRGRRRASACARATRAAARTASRWATSSPAPTSRRRPPCWPRAAGATSPARRSASSTSPRAASPRSGSSGSRRSGRSPSRWTA